MALPHADNKYITALINNDSTLLAELYEKYSGKIKMMVLKNNGSDTDAADVFQEALVSIFQKAKTNGFTLTCPLDAYLYLICKNRWINELNKRATKPVTFTDTEGYNYTENEMVEGEKQKNVDLRHTLLNEKLLELGDGCKQLLQLSWSGIGMEQVAEKLQNTYGYVRKKKSECMAKLINLVKASPIFANLKW